MSMADLLESRARQLYLDGRYTRAQYVRRVGRIRRVERLRLGIAALAVSAWLFLLMGAIFS